MCVSDRGLAIEEALQSGHIGNRMSMRGSRLAVEHRLQIGHIRDGMRVRRGRKRRRLIGQFRPAGNSAYGSTAIGQFAACLADFIQCRFVGVFVSFIHGGLQIGHICNGMGVRRGRKGRRLPGQIGILAAESFGFLLVSGKFALVYLAGQCGGQFALHRQLGLVELAPFSDRLRLGVRRIRYRNARAGPLSDLIIRDVLQADLVDQSAERAFRASCSIRSGETADCKR